MSNRRGVGNFQGDDQLLRNNEIMTESAPHRSPAHGSTSSSPTYSERLIPGFWVYAMWLLLIPAVLLAATPLSETWAWPVAIGAYLIVVVSFVSMSPVIRIQNGQLFAGSAHIDVHSLGEVETLNRGELRYSIGQGTDVRNHLVIRGYIHSGVRVEITDPNDPTPHWIITTRKPAQLKQAIQASQQGR